jgi:integrase/recombinase XerD
MKRSGHAEAANLVLYLDIDRDEVDAAGELL